jgi:hypothetical protein
MKHLKKTLVAGLLAACSHAWAAPTLSIVTTPNPAQLGSVVDVDVRISDAVDLYSYNFSLNFDASLFRAVGLSEGAFLGTAGATDFGYGGIDNATGSLSYVYGYVFGPEFGATGSGSLAHIQLEAIGIGSGAFSFSDLYFGDSAGAELAVTVDASAQADVPEPASYALFGIGLFGAAALRRRSLAPRA